MALDKVVDSAVLDAGMKSVADAIRAKAGTTDLLEWPDGFKAAVEGIQTGGGGGTTSDVAMKDVNFYDYDGTLVASYTLAEAQALTALPNGPTHDGLTFQGWNWSLVDLKTTNRKMNVGAMYITDDGKTRLYIHIADKARSTVPLYFSQTVSNGVTINWGDGSATETLSGAGNLNTSHAYGIAGDFTISLTVADGCTLILGAGSNDYCVMGSTGDTGKVYCNMLQKVEVGSGVTIISTGSFQNCSSLSSITIPDGVTSIGANVFLDCPSLSSITIPDGVPIINTGSFQNCSSLSSITIPDVVTNIRNQVFYYCRSLSSITIPDGVTSIGTYAFQGCYSLASITIPNGVTSIRDSAFSSCYGMRYYDFSACTSVPALSNTNAFRNIPSDCQMLIPSALYDEWSTATNWVTYASYMVAV